MVTISLFFSYKKPTKEGVALRSGLEHSRNQADSASEQDILLQPRSIA